MECSKCVNLVNCAGLKKISQPYFLEQNKGIKFTHVMIFKILFHLKYQYKTKYSLEMALWRIFAG